MHLVRWSLIDCKSSDLSSSSLIISPRWSTVLTEQCSAIIAAIFSSATFLLSLIFRGNLDDMLGVWLITFWASLFLLCFSVLECLIRDFLWANKTSLQYLQYALVSSDWYDCNQPKQTRKNWIWLFIVFFFLRALYLITWSCYFYIYISFLPVRCLNHWATNAGGICFSS